jgi:8-oxo-dGTP pyrophosphatase MutT (NUDIX family)
MNNPEHREKINLNTEDIKTRVMIESDIDRMLVKNIYYNVNFLMISRKHSLGYVEFIRGRYRPEKIDQVIYLFKQMMQFEIDKIKHSLTLDRGFDYLWKDFWGVKSESSFYVHDKNVSNSNYDMLKNIGIDGPELNLAYIVNNVKAEFDIEEWGFPKGRRNRVESDLECAIREFKEESGYSDEDFVIIKNIDPLVEELYGTNGIQYRHIYYVAELRTNKVPKNNITESQKDEIGNIQFMDLITAKQSIREYHVSRKVLLEKLFIYYLDLLIKSNRSIKREDNMTEKVIK